MFVWNILIAMAGFGAAFKRRLLEFVRKGPEPKAQMLTAKAKTGMVSVQRISSGLDGKRRLYAAIDAPAVRLSFNGHHFT
jgi:hypothetical protein